MVKTRASGVQTRSSGNYREQSLTMVSPAQPRKGRKAGHVPLETVPEEPEKLQDNDRKQPMPLKRQHQHLGEPSRLDQLQTEQDAINEFFTLDRCAKRARTSDKQLSSILGTGNGYQQGPATHTQPQAGFTPMVPYIAPAIPQDMALGLRRSLAILDAFEAEEEAMLQGHSTVSDEPISLEVSPSPISLKHKEKAHAVLQDSLPLLDDEAASGDESVSPELSPVSVSPKEKGKAVSLEMTLPFNQDNYLPNAEDNTSSIVLPPCSSSPCLTDCDSPIPLKQPHFSATLDANNVEDLYISSFSSPLPPSSPPPKSPRSCTEDDDSDDDSGSDFSASEKERKKKAASACNRKGLSPDSSESDTESDDYNVPIPKPSKPKASHNKVHLKQVNPAMRTQQSTIQSVEDPSHHNKVTCKGVGPASQMGQAINQNMEDDEGLKAHGPLSDQAKESLDNLKQEYECALHEISAENNISVARCREYVEGEDVRSARVVNPFNAFQA
ncbi:hypothetical protein Moror_3260 [Moniliophthora roreri MCA 2997]|uniref:Uncharacterized protein n=1 Tax=Moniliophthora roreri (strain MCA 2997) TaxID=1381753 RepID=V2WJ88_MONRO|nr:hypothetical protein Moror_3260 [Moniliophthora roreri MCA 2997]